MLRISSCTMTVLPVPAPPNSPIFEPLAKVQIRSMTLIPVSRISTLGCCSDSGGASRWIGHRFVPSGVGSSSIAFPITLNMRPSVSTPTGTEMGEPVACTGSPRRIPSVESIPMHRTTLSPMSDATSSTTLRPSALLTSRASKSSGWSPASNSPSTTAPTTWLSAPWPLVLFFSGFSLVFAIRNSFLARADGLGAAHDLHQLGRDAGLPDLVCVEGQRVDQVARGLGRILHRDHLGRVLARLVLEHRLENLGLDVPRQQTVEHGLGLRLVDVIGLRSLLRLLALGYLGGDQHADRRLLPEGREPLGVTEDDRVGVALRVLLQRDRDGGQTLAHARPVGKVAHLRDDVAPVAQEKVATLAPERYVLLVRRVVLVHVARRHTDVVDVDGTAQPLVGGDKDHHRAAAFPAHEEGVLVLGRPLADRLQDLDHLVGVGARRLDGRLRAAQTGRRHDLHRLGDLLRVLDRVDAANDVPE